MIIRPIHIKKASAFVAQYHRHSLPNAKGKFAISCWIGDEMIGVAIGGRPISRHLDNGTRFEVYRVCVKEGHKNACSFIYNRMKRIAQLMGYEKFHTYTLQTESGASLRAIGGMIVKDVNHQRDWNDHGKVKRKKNSVSKQLKFLWEL